ncbi:MAG: pectin lyase fold/virulence factor [Monoraphidium minutum]|nr:MAG: pectin lyase fold/virulence factor [Monoraphidium minutum]
MGASPAAAVVGARGGVTCRRLDNGDGALLRRSPPRHPPQAPPIARRLPAPRALRLALLLLAATAALLPRPAAAIVRTVMSNGNSGTDTLRFHWNNAADGDVIVFNDDYNITLLAAGTVISPIPGPPLSTTKEFTVDATGRTINIYNGLSLANQLTGNLFRIDGGGKVTFKNLRFPRRGAAVRVTQNAAADVQGCSFSAIETQDETKDYATLYFDDNSLDSSVSDCTFAGAAGVATPGRGISSASTAALAVSGCSFSGLRPPATGAGAVDGGGIYVSKAALTGGALYIGLGTRVVTITGSKLDSNRASSGGPAIFSDTNTSSTVARAVSISGTTLMNNSASYRGDTGVLSFLSKQILSVTLDTCTIAVDVTYSLFEAQSLDKQWFKEGNTNCTANLGPLQENGGNGPTRIPNPGSPALQSGSNAAAVALTTDQRGLPRIAGGVVDMGAVEAQSQGGSFSKCSLFNSTGLIIQAGTEYTCATMAKNGMVSLAKPDGGSFGTLCARYYQSVATTCNLTDPSNFKPGDPHLVGFDGTPFLFKGYPDAVFALISEQNHMVNALFGNIGPAHGLDTDVWMIGFGAGYGTALELELRVDVDPRDIELFRDEAAKHDTKMRVRLLDPKFLHIVVNGTHRDDLLRSGRAVEGLVGGATLYFPPPDAVNPGDASDGPLAILKTPLMELAFYLETEDALHLDLQARPHAPPLPPLRGRHRRVKLLDRPSAMSGVLGQTLQWALDGASGGAVADGVLAGDDRRFEVGDGLLGTRYAAGLFQSGGRAAGPAARPRALLLERGAATLAAFPLVAGSGSRLLL